MLVLVRVNEKPFWCSLDSGGGAVFSLDSQKAQAAGFKPNDTGFSAGQGSAVIRDQRIHGATLDMSGVTVRDQTVVLRPFPSEARFDCVMGLALLREYVVEFDYAKPEILDTGAGLPYFQLVLLSGFIKEKHVLDRVSQAVQPPDKPKGTGGEINLLASRIQNLKVGTVQLERPIVALFQTQSGGGNGPDGLLAARFFKKFTVTFDYAGQQMYLEPNANYTEPQRYDASGLGFQKLENGAYFVDVVVPNSPAAQAGIREGDVLVSIDNRDANYLDAEQIRAALAESGRKCVLGISRDGKRLTMSLRLKSPL